MKKPLSVLVCTHNRGDRLVGALESLETQTLAKDQFEVLVVDNASTDDTREIVAQFETRGTLALRYVCEQVLGLDHARNRGIREAVGDVVAFLDDDARAEPNWAEEIMRGFERHPVPILGGRVHLIWEATRPQWFSDELLKYLIHCDYGPEVKEITGPPWLYGTNVAFRRKIFERLGLFRLDLDRKGDSLMGGGDTEFFMRAHARGESLLYLPSLAVSHLVPASRLTRTFFRRRLFYSGFTRASHGHEGRAMVVANGLVFLLGAPGCALAAAALRLVGRTAASFRMERKTLLASGYLYYWFLRGVGKVPPPATDPYLTPELSMSRRSEARIR